MILFRTSQCQSSKSTLLLLLFWNLLGSSCWSQTLIHPASAFLMLGGQACATIPILLFCLHHGVTEADRNEFYTFITSASNRVSSPGWLGTPYSRENDLESVVRLLPLPEECCHTQYTVRGDQSKCLMHTRKHSTN